MGGIYSVALAIVGVAFLFTAVSHDDTAKILGVLLDGFTGSIKAATGTGTGK
jgi:hypothetical protein